MGTDLSGNSSQQTNGTRQDSRSSKPSKKQTTDKVERPIFTQLDENLRQLEEVFSRSVDIIFRHWAYGPELQHTACSVYYESLMQGEIINYMKASLQDLVTYEVGPAEGIKPEDVFTFFEHGGVSEKKADILDNLDHAVEQITYGNIVIFFNHWDKALVYKSLEVESRQISEPANESVVQGPRESTVENLKKNIGLLRMRLSTPKFKVESLTAGGATKTQVVYGYIEGMADPELLKEFEARIDQITNLEILETSYIEQIIEDDTWSPFPQHRYTERPDVAVAALLEGKIAVLVQGTGSILLCPGLFTEFFQSSEDYYQRTVYSTMIRWLRIIAFLLALTLPSIYIALSTFHTELIPTVLLLTIIDTREGIPLPAFFEALIMEFFFELLREAGVRLPKPIGSAVSIVGALVVGEAAINAGIASPIMVIIVALTGIASFAIPQYNIAIALRILKFPLMISATVMGGFGIMIVFLLILLHLCKLRSIGQPYMRPLAPFQFNQMRDVIVRVPLKKMLQSPRKHIAHPEK
ncbi:spore germination protein [Paenibacillus algorifonticola]|uniref:Spore germination protein n=1 Tax=Paenibacillus algorifonticola TaxID=684063 RepID=A0A1I2IK95_9BACL|nr:spore germination protein [Paenibacillus algorifonticola]SFF42684.1 spore germination protein [Paenibacillus algorifonticola]